MNKIFQLLLTVTFVCCSLLSFAQQVLSIEDVIQRTRDNSPFAKREETRRENRYWQYRYFRTNYNPQLRLEGTIPSYFKRVEDVRQNDGTIRYIGVEQTINNLNLGLIQPIALTGGYISANTSLGFFKDYRAGNETNGEQWSGTVMNIALSQPLFSFNPLRWDRRTEPLRYEESKRDYVEQIEFASRLAVERFFNVLQEQVNLQIASFNLANNDTIYKIEQGRYNIGTTSLDKLLQVELQLLRSRQNVAQANLDLQTAGLQLRSFIGINDGEDFRLVMPELIPQFDVSIDEALVYARQNRAGYIAFERRRIEAEREVAQAKGQRFQATLNAAYGLNNTGLIMNEVYEDPIAQQQFNLGISMPVLDWGRNKSRMQTAIANKKLNDYIIAQDELNFEQEVITQVRQFEMLRLQIDITKKSDEVAAERYNVAQNRYLIGKIDITNLNIALTEKDAAKQSYIQALKSFWIAYYELRRLTLYDFANKQLLYKPEN